MACLKTSALILVSLSVLAGCAAAPPPATTPGLTFLNRCVALDWHPRPAPLRGQAPLLGGSLPDTLRLLEPRWLRDHPDTADVKSGDLVFPDHYVEPGLRTFWMLINGRVILKFELNDATRVIAFGQSAPYGTGRWVQDYEFTHREGRVQSRPVTCPATDAS